MREDIPYTAEADAVYSIAVRKAVGHSIPAGGAAAHSHMARLVQSFFNSSSISVTVPNFLFFEAATCEMPAAVINDKTFMLNMTSLSPTNKDMQSSHHQQYGVE